MNLNSVTSSMSSGLEFLETTVDKHVEFVKTGGEEILNVAEKVTVESGKCVVGGIEGVGEGVKVLGETATSCLTLVDDGVENILKFKRICQKIYEVAFTFKSYLEDDHLIESTIALSVWLVVCYFFEIWMIPAVVIIIYVKNLIFCYVFGTPVEEDPISDKSIKGKMEAIDEILDLVRIILSNLEVILHKIFEFIDMKTLSWLAILTQVVITFILMVIPINYLLMLLGITLYSKKFLKNLTSPGRSATSDEKTKKLQD